MALRPRMRPFFEIPMKADGSRTMARIAARLAAGEERAEPLCDEGGAGPQTGTGSTTAADPA